MWVGDLLPRARTRGIRDSQGSMQELSFGGEIPGGRRRRAPQGFDCYPESAIRQLSARLGVDCGFPLSRNF